MGGAVLPQDLGRQLPPQHADQILGGHAVAGLIEEHRQETIRCASEKGLEDHDCRHRVIGTAAMTANPSGRTCGREDNDRVAAELNGGPQRRLLIGAQNGLVWIEAEGLKSCQIDREGHGHRSHRQNSGGFPRWSRTRSAWIRQWNNIVSALPAAGPPIVRLWPASASVGSSFRRSSDAV